MEFKPLTISGAFEIRLSPIRDDRGSFSRIFCQDEFRQIGFTKHIVQVNHSVNKIKGTIRGMHFQYPPHAECKIIRCLRGKVLDVVLDLRCGSPTFLQWDAIELSPENYNLMYIPEGCAHGFQTLEEDSELLYFHSEFYHPEVEGAVRFDDPLIHIAWPLPPLNVSEKDKRYPFINNSYSGITL